MCPFATHSGNLGVFRPELGAGTGTLVQKQLMRTTEHRDGKERVSEYVAGLSAGADFDG
jgi:hypothetical protein